jgi:hypothetical protein
MPRIVRQGIAISLVACLLLLAGLAFPQTVAHATHHAHHKAATHASPLCSWLCAAGQVLEAISFGHQPETDPLTVVAAQVPISPPGAILPAPSTRGPPAIR